MFSIMTIASSTTKPVAIVNAISERLLRLNPARYITAKVPTSDSDIDGGGKRRSELRQQFLDAVDNLDDVGAGLALDIEDDRLLRIHPGGELGVLRPFLGLCDVRQLYRRAVTVGDHQIVVVGGLPDLIVGVDRVGPARSIEAALRHIDIGGGERRAQIVDI